MRYRLAIALAIVVMSAGFVRAEDAYKPDDEGFIRNWLILAPISNGDNVSGLDALNKAYLADEGNLKPKAGDKVKVDDQELTWKPLNSNEFLFDINGFLGQQTENSTCYAVTYLVADDELKDLNLKIGSNDEAKVYLNGKELIKNESTRVTEKDQDTVANITLNKGVNVVVFKVVNELRAWSGALRFTDKNDAPVKNLKVQLTP
jgi:hypothetical protein